MKRIQSIQTRIYELRGERVMLDFDLAVLYEVETRILNQAVKRNEKRFPDDFMFQLSDYEWELLQQQMAEKTEISAYESYEITTLSSRKMSSQIVMTSETKKRPRSHTPYAFTEQGVAMLSGILNSEKAITMNIAIMRAFVEVRRVILQQDTLKGQLDELKQRLGEHDVQLNQIYEALENLLDEKAAERSWEGRERIGFRKG